VNASTNTQSTNTCLICDHSNRPTSTECDSCSAPLAIAQDAVVQERAPQIVSIIGESNVGKTVYLGFLLDMLTQRAGEFKAVPKGAYSIDLLQNVIGHLAQRTFPPKTPMEADQWYWAYYQVFRNSLDPKWVDLLMPDIAGESLAAEVATPNTFKVIRNLLYRSAGSMLLIDAALAANGSPRPDFFGVKMLSYIDSMHEIKRNEYVETPTAVVLCKADYCPECFDDPRQFAQANLHRLWNVCESRFANVEFFACSVVGSMGYATSPNNDYVIPRPLHTALQGILEPFEWITDQL